MIEAAPVRRRLEGTAPGHRYSRRRTLAILCGLMVATMVTALDQTVIATALPAITSDLGGVSSYSWIFTAYLLCQTISVPVYGRLGDMYGRRRLLIVGIAIYLAGSTLAGLSHSMTELVLSRCVQGIGGGGVIPLGLAIVADIIPARDRGRYQAFISAGFAAAAVLGPTVGGIVTDLASWRWIFYLNLPIGAAALGLVMFTLPRMTPVDASTRMDYRGAALLTTAAGAFLLALVWGGESHPWLSRTELALALVAVGSSLAYVAWARRATAPIVPLGLVRTPIVATGAAGVFCGATCMFGTVAFVPLFAQGALGQSAASSGLVLTPLVLAATTATIVSGQWVARTGRYRRSALLGPVLVCFGMILLARMDASTSVFELSRNAALVGLGVGSMMQVFFLTTQNTVGSSLLGTATAFLHFSRGIGTVVGVTLFGVMVDVGLSGRSVAQLTGAHSESQRSELASAITPAFAAGAAVAAILWFVVFVGLEERPLRTTVHDVG